MLFQVLFPFMCYLQLTENKQNKSWTALQRMCHENGGETGAEHILMETCVGGACRDNATEDKQQQQTPVTTQQISCIWYSSLSGAWGVSWKYFSGYRLLWKSLKQDWDMQWDRWWQWHRCPFGFHSAWSNICSVHRLKALPHRWRTRWFACFRCRCQPLGCSIKRTFLMPLATPTGCNK